MIAVVIFDVRNGGQRDAEETLTRLIAVDSQDLAAAIERLGSRRLVARRPTQALAEENVTLKMAFPLE